MQAPPEATPAASEAAPAPPAQPAPPATEAQAPSTSPPPPAVLPAPIAPCNNCMVVAEAPVPDPSIRRHDGFYMRLGLGAGYVIDRLTQPDDFDGGVTLKGAAVATEITFGGTVGPVAIFGGIFNHVAPKLEGTFDFLGRQGEASLATSILTLYAVGVDVYPDPSIGAHFEAGVGAMVLAMGESDGGSDSASFCSLDGCVQQVSPPDVEPNRYTSGIGGVLGGGYEWWIGEQWSMGLLGRVVIGRVQAPEDSQLQVVVIPALLGAVTYH